MPETYDALAETFCTARNPEKGKPLEHATRLFADEDGTLAIRYHATKVVFVHKDGTYTLANGGWNTITTLQKIRSYTPAKLFSERGEWYLRLQPSKRDPEPECVDRSIPKPYQPAAKVFPGAEPVKTDDGFITFENDKRVQTYTSPCMVGQHEEYSYIVGNYAWGDKEIPPGAEPNVGQYSDVKTEGMSGRLYGDYFTWHNGVIAYGATQYEPYGEVRVKLGKYTDYKQCPHCKAYDDLLSRWKRLMYGGWDERRFDDNTGWDMWSKMMTRFRTVEAWQQAYLTDLRDRRAYLKAYREWDDRNKVAFYDGVKIDKDGYALRSQHNSDLKFQRKLARHGKEVEKIKKRIDKYVKGYIDALSKGMPMPGPGDCWYCLMFDAIPPNEPGARRQMHRGSTISKVNGDHDHLIQHFEDKYYVPSLAVNALRERGYQDVGVYMHLDMDPDNNTMGKQDGRYDSVARDIKTYLRKRLIPTPPTR